MNYTKGDWEQVFDGIMYYVDVVGRKRNDFSIANCYHNKANAHLIAAAPDMYEALNNVRTLIVAQFPQLIKSYTYGLIDKALAKAEEAQ